MNKTVEQIVGRLQKIELALYEDVAVLESSLRSLPPHTNLLANQIRAAARQVSCAVETVDLLKE